MEHGRCHLGAIFICFRAIQMSKVYPINDKKNPINGRQYATECYITGIIGIVVIIISNI